MNFGDILALAKQGYKPSDIKELLALSTDTTPSVDINSQAPLSLDEPVFEHSPSPSAAPIQPEVGEEGPDVGIYEQKIAELERKLAAAQKANLSQNLNSQTKTDEEVLSDLAKSFF